MARVSLTRAASISLNSPTEDRVVTNPNNHRAHYSHEHAVEIQPRDADLAKGIEEPAAHECSDN